jgi:hypothetical protein
VYRVMLELYAHRASAVKDTQSLVASVSATSNDAGLLLATGARDRQ